MKKIVILGLATLLLTGCLKQKSTTGESKIEEFTGNLKEAMGLNLPMKCEWSQNENSGVSYVKGKEMYIESTVQGKTGYMIQKDNCMWTWSKGETKGVKICSEPAEETEAVKPEVGEFQTGGVDWSVKYKCAPAVFGADKFEPPSGIEFQDIAEMMKGTVN